MNGRTRVLIGLTLIALGGGVVALGYVGGESNVRYVEDLMARPDRHEAGSYLLMGVPQPEFVPITGASGVELSDNPQWSNTTATTVRWSDDNSTWFSTRSVSAETLATGETGWTYRNETRALPSDATLAFPPTTVQWTTTARERAFPVQAFDDGDGDSPRLWALYSGPVKDPMQPKPSQFTGHLLATLPDGTPVPDGVHLFAVESYKAGCSSKFLPPEEKERQGTS